LHLKRIQGAAEACHSIKKQIPNKPVKQNKNEMLQLFKVCMERVLAMCAKVVSKSNWIAQHSQLTGQLTRVVINRFSIVKH